MKIIHVAVVAFLHDDKVLLVRKRGTKPFILPGGKFLKNETPATCLVREVKEELDVEIHAEELEFLGEFSAPAANEAETLCCCQSFYGTLNKTPIVRAEIEELLWHSLGSDRSDLAPLLVQFIIPSLKALRDGKKLKKVSSF